MSSLFASSRSKIARAKEHFVDLTKRINDFVNIQPYERVIENDPDRPGYSIHKVRLSKPLPESVLNVFGDLVGNLRSSLDRAAYTIAVHSGKSNPRNAAFPFGRSIDDFMNCGLGRCKDLPKDIYPLFVGFQPYLGGDDLLWALNEVCNSDKHTIVRPLIVAISRGSGIVWAKENIVFLQKGWDSTKNGLELFSAPTGTQVQYDFDFETVVAFSEIKTIDGKPIIPILDNLFGKVERILMAMEAESRRLGIVK